MIRPRSALRGLALAAAIVTVPAVAADDRFALAIPINAPPESPVFAIDVPAEAYATLTSPTMADLVVVDSAGREQPFSWQRSTALRPPEAPEVLRIALPIALPGATTSTPGSLELHVRREPDGALAALDLRSTDGAASGIAAPEWLVDVGSAASGGIDGLRLTPQGVDDFRTLVDLRGSDDLVHWEPLASALPLFRASDGGRRIEKLELRFHRTSHRYLALTPGPGQAGLPPLAALEGLRSREAERAPLATYTPDAVAVSTDGRTIEFPPLGPLPVQQVDVRLPEGGGILEYRVEQRSGERWLTVASGSAWRLAIGGETLEASPVALSPNGTGPLRLQLGQAALPPRLVLGYVPDRLVVVPQGSPPYRLLAGSAQLQASPVGVDDTLAAIRRQQGEDWQPPLATLGAVEVLGGPAALVPKADWGRWVLWAVLALGALLVGGLAWRMLGSAPAGD